jgi:hypothetical protein
MEQELSGFRYALHILKADQNTSFNVTPWKHLHLVTQTKQQPSMKYENIRQWYLLKGLMKGRKKFTQTAFYIIEIFRVFYIKTYR